MGNRHLIKQLWIPISFAQYIFFELMDLELLHITVSFLKCVLITSFYCSYSITICSLHFLTWTLIYH